MNPQINWDGKLLGCCLNFWGDFGGNAFEQGLEHVLSSENLAYARRMLQRAPPRISAFRVRRVAYTSNDVRMVVGSTGGP